MADRIQGTDHRGIDIEGPEDAPDIVFLHGVMFTRKLWVPQREMLSDAFRVVTVDLPGHGEHSGEDFRLDRAVEIVDEAIETHADGNALLVGLSLGGYTATAYASRHPENVDGLVISGSTANPVDTLETLTGGVGGIMQRVTKSERIKRKMEGIAEQWVRKLTIPEVQKAEIIDSGFYPEQWGNAGKELAGRDFRSAFGDYPGPSLVLNGSRDVVNRRGETKHAAAAHDARVEVIPGAGHTCNLHDPTAYVNAVRRFHENEVAVRAGVE